MVMFYIISVSIITFLIHFLLYALTQFDRKKKQERMMIENAALILSKIDEMKKPRGGTKMNEDLKKVAKYMAAKIDKLKEELVGEIDTRFEELNSRLDELDEMGEEEAEADEEPEEEENFESLLEDEPKLEEPEIIETPGPPPKKELPPSLDISKRQISQKDVEGEIQEEKKKKKKKGFFGRSKEEK